jgi:hypothetical protein
MVETKLDLLRSPTLRALRGYSSRPPRGKLLIWPTQEQILNAKIAKNGRAEDTERRSLERGRYEEFLRLRIVLYPQHVGLAADLAVFDITLPAPCGFIHGSWIPLAATRTLKTSFHKTILFPPYDREHFYKTSLELTVKL